VTFWTGCTHSYAGVNKSPQLFGSSNGTRPQATFQDCDWSGFNSTSGAYVNLAALYGMLRFFNCKLSSTPGLETGTLPTRAGEVCWINSDSADTRNVFRLVRAEGTLIQDSTYYRTNGAKMWSSGIAWKLVTNANCTETTPFVCPFIVRSLTTAQSTTFSLELMRGNATLLTDRQAWMRLERVNDASFPLGAMATTRNAAPFIGTGSNLTSSSEAWAGSLANATPQKIATTLTPAELSPIRAQFVYAVASDTVYIDPALVISGQTDGPSVLWAVDGSAWNGEPSSGSTVRIFPNSSRIIGG
jgi:hypothetical protein